MCIPPRNYRLFQCNIPRETKNAKKIVIKIVLTDEIKSVGTTLALNTKKWLLTIFHYGLKERPKITN